MKDFGKTVIIDFNDSFTYNIYELLRIAGYHNYSVQPIETLEPDLFEFPDRIILSPGPDVPQRYPQIYRLLDRLTIIDLQIPILGICLGHQILHSYFGGSLINLETVVHGQACLIRQFSDDSLFNGIPESFTVGLYHSWAVAKPLPECLELTAESERGIVMAFAHKTRPIRGVQFHPESFISEHGEKLLTNFLNIQ